MTFANPLDKGDVLPLKWWSWAVPPMSTPLGRPKMLTAKVVKGSKDVPDKLVIECDYVAPAKAPTSASGKSKVLASTQGNQKIAGERLPEGFTLGLNAYVKA